METDVFVGTRDPSPLETGTRSDFKGSESMRAVSTRGRPTHYKPLAYGVGIEIVGFDYGVKDYVKWRYAGEKKIRRNIVYYSSSGEPYFKSNGSKHYLNEFMRY